jgi:prefoldin alpha subunit
VERKEEIEQQVKENVLFLKNMEVQMGLAQQQFLNFDRALAEISVAKTALTSLKLHKKEAPSILSLGSGVFANCLLPKQENVFVDVGAGVIVEKTIDDAFKILEDREKEIETNLQNFQRFLSGLEKQYGEVSAKTQELLKG